MAKRSSSSRQRLDRLLQDCETPLFVVTAKRKIIFFNRGCEVLTGWPAEEVQGTVCHFASSAVPESVEALAQSLCPPPDVLEGQTQQVPVEILTRRGERLPRLIHFHPLFAGADVFLVVGLVGEIPPPPAAPAPQRQRDSLHAELAKVRARLQRRYGEVGLIGREPALQRVAAQMASAGQSDIAVLLQGEPGTGKEHVARLIHQTRTGGRTAFVPLECSRLPARELRRTLQRLFAESEESGLTENAGEASAAVPPGTLYLKDVERLPRDAQEIVLQYYQQPPSPGKTIRLMAATTTPLAEAVENDLLRSELYYLLTPLQIELPPLRSRPDDVELLAQAFLEEGNRVEEKQIGGFSEAVRQQFRRYRWPGNLDELQAVVQEAREACSGTVIDVSHLPFRFRTGQDAQSLGPPPQPPIPPLAASLEEIEADLIRTALQRARYNKTLAAQWLGLSRPKLYRRMQALHIADEPPAETESPPS